MRRFTLTTCTILLAVIYCTAQKPLVGKTDSLPVRLADSTGLATDSLGVPDERIQGGQGGNRQYRLSADSLEAKVEYGARDSSILDIQKQVFHLYGQAFVRYQSLELRAGYIRFDMQNDEVTATGWPDSSGAVTGIPEFKEGDQAFSAARMRYNFKTRKGKTWETMTLQGDLTVHSGEAKFVAKDEGAGREEDVLYSQGALFTTCDLPDPHFGIRSSKQKVVTDKVAVVGLSNLEIAGVKTPLILPFGFFPLKKGQRAGLIFPRDYEYSPRWGFGLSNVGYYLPISDYLDAQLTGDIYFRGSYGLQAQLRYKKRYKYSGSVNLAYSRFVEERQGELGKDRTNSFNIRINHQQDPKAHPYVTFGGSVNIQTNRYQSLNYNDQANVLNNQLSSNFSYRHRLPGSPFSLSASFNHSQNTRTRQVNVTLPSLDVRMERIFPFKRKERVGKERWYEKISLNYNSSFQNRFNAVDSLLFSRETWDNSRMGVRHNADMDVNFRALKYFNLSPFVRITETWYNRFTEKRFVEDLVIEMDTIYNMDSTQFEIVRDTVSYGEVEENRRKGFKAGHEIQAGISLNTQIFGTLYFKKGWLRGLRHVIRPSISLNYQPSYVDGPFDYYEQLVQVNNRGERDTTQYSIFENELFGGPSRSGEVFGLSYNINNIFEAKVFSGKDSTERKMKLFNNIIVSGSYNFAADSLGWSPVRVSGNTRLFDNLTTVSLNATWDPYAESDLGRRINQLYLDREGKPLRFVSASVRISTGASVKRIRQLFSGEKNDRSRQPSRGLFEGSLADIFDDIRISHNINISRRVIQGEATTDISTHSISARGRIPLSAKWNFNIGNIDYNFVRESFSYPDLGFSRDLHCWEMGMDWQPVRGTYSFYLRVKPGSLDFIKIPYRKNRSDALGGF